MVVTANCKFCEKRVKAESMKKHERMCPKNPDRIMNPMAKKKLEAALKKAAPIAEPPKPVDALIPPVHAPGVFDDEIPQVVPTPAPAIVREEKPESEKFVPPAKFKFPNNTHTMEQFQIDAIYDWQFGDGANDMHPMTCRNNSKHNPMVGVFVDGVVALACPDCGKVQYKVSSVVYDRWRDILKGREPEVEPIPTDLGGDEVIDKLDEAIHIRDEVFANLAEMRERLAATERALEARRQELACNKDDEREDWREQMAEMRKREEAQRKEMASERERVDRLTRDAARPVPVAATEGGDLPAQTPGTTQDSEEDARSEAMRLRTAKSRLRGECMKLKRRFAKLPVQIREDSQSTTEALKDYISALARAQTTAGEVQSIEMELDTVALEADTAEDEARNLGWSDGKSTPDGDMAEVERMLGGGGMLGGGNSGAAGLKRQALEMMMAERKMENRRRELENMKVEAEIEAIRGKSAHAVATVAAAVAPPVEKKLRVLPNGDSATLTDSEYLDFTVRWEQIQKSKKESSGGGEVDFPIPQPDGRLIMAKIKAELVPQYQAMFVRPQTNELEISRQREMREMADRIVSANKASSDSQIRYLEQQVQQQRAQGNMNPIDTMTEYIGKLKTAGMVNTSGDTVALEQVRNQGRYMDNSMNIFRDQLNSVNGKMDKLVDMYTEGQKEVIKEAAKLKALARAQPSDIPPRASTEEIDAMIGRIGKPPSPAEGQPSATGLEQVIGKKGKRGMNTN